MYPKLVLGTVQFGLDYGINNKTGRLTEKQIFELLDEAAKLGIETLDTSALYGNSEKIIGNYNWRNPSFSINTKIAVDENSTIAKQVDQALNILQTETINCLFFHRFDDLTEDSFGEMKNLQAKGIINEIGVSVYTNNEIKEAEAFGPDTIQFPFNMLDNLFQRKEAIEESALAGVNNQVRSAFLQGLFFMKPNQLPEKLKPLEKHIFQLQKLCEQNKISMENMALSYCYSQPLIDEVVIGVDSIAQLKKNLEALEEPITNNLKETIDQIVVTETELLSPVNWK